MRIYPHAAYLQGDFPQMRRDDWDALKYIKALKGDPINGYANFRFDRFLFTINAKNADPAFDFFAFWAERAILGALPFGKVHLIPVPNKSALVGSTDPFKTLLMADRIARRMPDRFVAVPCLRWATLLEKARTGGPRDVKTLTDNLRFVGPTPDGGNVVLIDDTYVTGSSLKACVQVLSSWRISVQAAFCAGRTVREQVPKPFELEPFDYSDTDFTSLDDLSAFLE